MDLHESVNDAYSSQYEHIRTLYYRRSTIQSVHKMEVLSTFTKPFPNTIYWNSSKHGGISKKVRTKEIEFKSNEGVKTLSYSDFISLVRELYACTLPLTKINLIIRFHKL